jgi:Tfp pilus assembly protein PilZ
MAQLASITSVQEAHKPQTERRRVPRIPFRATSVVSESGTSQTVVAQTTELSRFGCFVQTIKPHSPGTRVLIQIVDGGEVFTASGQVAYVTCDGMAVVFNMVEPENYETLAKWLSRTPRRSDRYAFTATAEVRDLGSRNEVVAITRDLSKGGCFVKTTSPLAKGSRLLLRIEHAGIEFTATARVTDNVTSIGMGLEFIELSAKDRAILEKWLGK